MRLALAYSTAALDPLRARTADTAEQLGDACSRLVAGSWREQGSQSFEQDKALVAKDVLNVLQAPERIAASLELHEHVTDHLDDVLLKGAEGEAAQPADVSWAAMQRGFMEARDYSMLYLGVTLCRRQGDANTTLATEAEVEALLARDWSQLIASAAGD